MGYLAAIAVLVVLIIVHELGHFLAARLQGIHANRFSLGFGPILWKYQGPETEYAIRAIPLGGFVGFPDEDPDSTIPPDDPDLLNNRPLLDRAIVISAGVIANLIFAYVVLVLQFGFQGVPDGINYQPGVLVPQVLSSDTPAAQAGIRVGDIIVSIDGQQLGASERAIGVVQETIQSAPNQPLNLTVERENKIIPLRVTPQPGPDGKGRIGVQLFPNGTPTYRSPQSLFEVLGLAAEQFEDIVVRTVQGFGQLITNFSSMAGQVGGPVRIVEEGAKLARSDSGSLLFFAAIISVNLAILNILPLPALDGGQLAFLLVEGLRGKPLPTKVQENVMQTGIMLLLGLGIFLIIRDTTQLEFIQQLLE
ncbi:MAG: RIP metalloprotease RseP [Roseofilum sp. SBFL]|uniref:RIP metalloprotease RseP n=1 Tax=unclassified Roseofilum TaxID=2620099 RepID=UPI001B08B742|nr:MULTISPECIES: RIP metalloprotease RseP [unclassified Roseofilum]MBP0013851.1 RIP metalloprotease RseP [Roseofilum sp. SID3]MBP0023683.1 RIP metalloprotease RseP [Roseofilum sp. SID2]MBP0036087.1 RIP metalloprotease RseP [Roseofilum sp. SID1]MBP0041679.1 RIP metalloprotease RseP [Roseofilum sp. SBFL]